MRQLGLHLRTGAAALGLALLVALALPAAAARWQPLGPANGATPLNIAFAPSDPSILYTGTAGGGVSRSEDGGRTWVPANRGLTFPMVLDLAVASHDPLRVWAATSRGLFRSRDGGRSWLLAFEGYVDAVEVDPENASIVYIGTSDRMYRSSDGGSHWTMLAPYLVPNEIRFWVPGLAVAPSRPRTLYASYFGYRTGIFVSDNGGISWRRTSWAGVRSLAVDPLRSRTVWSFDGALARSMDGGKTWKTMFTNGVVSSLAFHPTDPGTLYIAGSAGVFVTTDGGVHWLPRNTGLPGVPLRSLALDPEHPETLLAGTAGAGMYRSDDGGANWQRSSDGLINFGSWTLAAAPDGSALWTGSPEGLYRWTGVGLTWERVLEEPVLSLAVAPSDPMTIYAGGGNEAAGTAALWRSRDGGTTWERADTGLTRGPILALAIHPEDPDTVYAGAWDLWTEIWDSSPGVFKTSDGGTTWSVLPLRHGAAGLALDPTDPETVFATQKRDLWRSHDGGATWRKIMNGEIRNLSARLLHGVAVAPSDPQSLAVFDDRRTFTSRDGGRTWARRTGFGGDPQNQVLAFAPDEAQSLVLGTAFGVFVSRDGGKVWRPAGLTGLVVGGLVFDPTDPKRLYAATWAAGVFVLDPAP